MLLQVVKRAYLQAFSKIEILLQQEATRLSKQQLRTLSFLYAWQKIYK